MTGFALFQRLNRIGLLGALLLAPATPSLAAPTIIEESFQDFAISTCTTGPADVCTVEFPALPLTFEAILTHASCFANITANSSIFRFTLAVVTPAGGATGLSNALLPLQVGATTAVKSIEANQTIVQLVRDDHKVRITMDLFTGDITQLACNIMGILHFES
jgi:hypothetical protein